MSNWVVSDIVGGDDTSEVSSISSNQPAQVNEISGSQNPRVTEEVSSLVSTSQPDEPVMVEVPEESITQLGSSYEIRDFTKKKSSTGPVKTLPNWLLGTIVMAPILLIFIVSAFSNKKEAEPEGSFLFKTLESKYFSMNYSPDYDATSVVDKKVPFVEKHDLVNHIDGQKDMSIVIKDVKFDYSLDGNSLVKARRADPSTYSEEAYTLKYKQGTYFKKTKDNFEHVILLVDRSKSLLYEIVFVSPSSFSDDEDMLNEMNSLLESFTFL